MLVPKRSEKEGTRLGVRACVTCFLVVIRTVSLVADESYVATGIK
jgi:hypothetical protein